MAWAASYAYNNTAAVLQTWNRTHISDKRVRYVNDTARAIGVEQYFDFNISSGVETIGGVKYPWKRWNVRFSSRIVASEVKPYVISFTQTITDTLANSVTTARTLLKDLKLQMLALCDADSEIDDITACRLL